MARIVGGFVMPHEPGIFYKPKDTWSEPQQRVMHAFDTIRARLQALGATLAVVVGADHYVLFGPSCLPSYLIGVGDVSGPYERFPGIARDQIPSHPAFAAHIAEHGRQHGFDWAVAKSLQVDHSIGVPARLCALPVPTLSTVVPVYLASGVEPLIPKQRAYDVGQAIRHAVQAWPEDERVVVLGSGGISHWVGMAEMGKVNSDFDRHVLDCVVRGDHATLIAMDDDEILRTAGNGALEIRSFICAMGATQSASGQLIAYEAGPDWVSGLGFAELYAT